MINFLHYCCEFKISTGSDSKSNPKNEIVWKNRKILVGKKTCFLPNLVWRWHYQDKLHTCTLCKTEKQTTNHLLFHCTESNAFWLEFTSWWCLKYKQVITLTECVVLYGYHNSIKNKQALMSLSSSPNITFSLQVHATASYLLKAFFSASKTT